MSMVLLPRGVLASTSRRAVFTLSFALACLASAAGCSVESSAPSAPSVSATTKPTSVRTAPARRTPQPTRQPADTRGVAFADVAARMGLKYTWPQQPRPMPIREAFGSGCAAFDADNDGWMDVLLVGDPHPALFRNDAGATFTDVTADSGLARAEGDWMGCAVGDYNGDGRWDILLTGFHCLALFVNRGQMKFDLVTLSAGLPADDFGHWGSSAGFMDLDGDNWLDIVILHYVEYGPGAKRLCEFQPGVYSGCTPREYRPEKGVLWRNTGDGTFERVPEQAGMDQTHGTALVLAFSDLDGDGLIDFYIGNDGLAADVMHNRGNMCFENIGFISGLAVSDVASAMSAMGADWADFDRDGLLDLTVTNFQHRAFAVFRNQGNSLFIDIADRSGVAQATKDRLGFGAKWLDFDNDGWPDISYANGHVYDNAEVVDGPGATYRQPLSLFRNDRGRRFVELTSVLGPDVQRAMVARGSAVVDFNNDGRADLLVVDFEGPVMLLENRTETPNHWLTLDLRAPSPNVFACGARVVGKAGNQTWVAEVAPASSYLSSSDPRIHWGLGEIAQLESVVIRWPSGREQTLHDVAADQILLVNEPLSQVDD
jgi:hypothetical protein